MTVLDLIKSSLKLIGVYGAGETPSNDDAQDAFDVLNMMIGSWNNDGLMMYQILDETFSLISGTRTYTIGASQALNTTRPTKIDSAYIRDSSNQDYGVEIIMSDEYNSVYDKIDTRGRPQKLYYNAAYPSGTIYLYPVPDAAYTLGLSQWKQLTAFTGLTQTISLPPGYEMALRYNLAIEMAPEFRATITPEIQNGAMTHKAAIQRLNNRTPYMVSDFQMSSVGEYDITSDRFL